MSTRTESRTYRGAAEGGAPRLTALPGVHRDETDPQQVLETERYDTDDRRLAAAGIALAVRRGDPAAPAQWQLDLPDGDGRERLRVPIPPDDVAAPTLPAELDELIRGFTRGRPVRPAGRVRIVRTVTRLLDADDRPLAELVHDQLTAGHAGQATELAAWTEVELRPGPAGAGRGDRAAAARGRPAPGRTGRRRRAGPAAAPGAAGAPRRPSAGRPAPPSSTTWPRTPTGWPPRSCGSAAASPTRCTSCGSRPGGCAARCRPSARCWTAAAPTRSSRTCASSAGELAPARDAEVLNERISAALAALEPELLLGPVQAQVTRHFARAEAEAGAAVLSALDGERYARLRAALEELVPSAADQEGEAGPRPRSCPRRWPGPRAGWQRAVEHRHRPGAGRRAARPGGARRPQGRASGCATPPRWRARSSGRTPSGSPRR